MKICALFLACVALAGCASVNNNVPAPRNAATDESLVVVTVRNSGVPVAARAGSSPRGYEADSYGATPRARADVRALEKTYGLRTISGWPIEVLGVHCVVYAVSNGANVGELLNRLRRDRRVESAQPLQSFATLSSPYTDPYAHLQSNLAPLRVVEAHRVSRGDGVRVAVIDTGIDAAHPDLQGRVIERRNLVDGSLLNGSSEKHGTAIAGVIAALDNNRQGIVGIAPAADLLALRACWSANKDDARAVCNSFTLAQALAAAIELRADVVNLSLSGPDDPLLARLVKVGIDRGMIYVGAMPISTAVLGFPVSTPGVIRVDSADSGQTNIEVLRAPGAEILTLSPAGGYDFLSGSSLAAANVSGGIALLLAHRPKLDRTSVSAALTQSMQRNSNSGVDLCAALATFDSQVRCGRE
ncbi:MAG: S8 family serine peptidase [Candidatus Obscuribacterales bacterium]|nr:S8 family serine peptidase [Steroidobacteraceae bacterium]